MAARLLYAGKSPVMTKTKISDLISEEMRLKGVSIRDIAEGTDRSYEHIRKLVKGIAIPSVSIIRAVAGFLEIDFQKLYRLSQQDSITKKYGDVPLEMAHKKPSLEPLDRVWDDLTKQQQDGIISMAQGWARQNRMTQ